MEEKITDNLNESAEIKPNEPTKQEMPKVQRSTKTIAIVACAVAAIAVLIITLLLFGGSKNNNEDADSNNGGASAEQIREVEFGFAESVYNKLNSASKTCDELIRGIYDAWYFAIYESDDCLEHNRGWELSYKLDFDYSEIEYAMAKLGVPVTAYYIFEDFNYTVQIVDIVYESRGVYTKVEEEIDFAKTLLQKISSENYEYTKHEELMSYYSDVVSCLDFIKSPSGSLSQLQSRIANYEANISTHKNKLSITFD